MSVHVEGELPTSLTVLDQGARETMQTAKEALEPIVEREVPKASGETARALKPRVSRTATGASLLIAPPRGREHGKATIAQVVRWVEHGTGLYRVGPGPKHRIRAKNPLKRMVLPGGRKVRSVKGQRPNPFMQRIEDEGTPIVERTAREGAEEVARRLERSIR